ncbi:hypothetical protein [Bacteroides heparinolyticus]|uniref:hypothetical protein n=1 Tax=Prevotella heparinolytica TaxID=28113 RepID=UPI0035A0F8B9
MFSIDKIKLVYRHSTLFRHSKYTLTADPNDLKARWVRTEKLPNFPNNGIQFAPWDLYNQSLSINIYIQERDDNQTIKKKVSSTYTYTNKSSFEISASGKENEITTVKKSGFEHAQTTTSTKEEEIITSVGSDNLGSIHLYFYDPVISDGSMGKYGLFGMHTASNGTVEAIILPKRIKK